MNNRFYLHALGITALFVVLMILFWVASERPASETEVRSANNTRTAIAMTGSYLLQPTATTQPSFTITPASLPQTRQPRPTSALPSAPSPTSTSLFPQLNSPTPSVAATFTPFPTLTAVAQVPVFTFTSSPEHANTKAPALVPHSETRGVIQAFPQSAKRSLRQDPADFVRWYFTRVWNERDYQNLWDNYLTAGYKSNVGSGLFEDYVFWWDSVERVDVNAAEVLQNNGSDALVRVDLTFRMQDGRLVGNQIHEYHFRYDPSRNTWMFDFR